MIRRKIGFILFYGVVLLGATHYLGGFAMAFQLQTDAFESDGKIPAQYTCDGENLSPPLMWQGAPSGAKSFALILDDPDAPMGTWVHWVVYDIPAAVSHFEEGVLSSETIQEGAKQGITDFGRPGYGGPCPPPGASHRYFFKLYALDTLLNLPPHQTKSDLLTAMHGHILAQAEWMGRYQRNK